MDLVNIFQKFTTLLVLASVLVFVYVAGLCLYNIFFHRLRKFPGPKTAAATPLPHIYHAIKGDVVFWIVHLHEQYGEIVRVSPNELSFSGADAWRDIYGHRRSGQRNLVKDPAFYRSPGEETENLVNAGDESHSRMRRIFAHAFSDRALKMQEPLFLTYVDKLVRKLRESIHHEPKTKFNMVHMLNYTTFDIMGDLTFGEPLQMLDDSSYHPWVAAIFAGFKFGVYLHSIRYLPLLETLLLKCIPESIREKQRLHNAFSVARVDRRMEKTDARPDIWGLVLEKEEHRGLSREEMYTNANLFMIGGTETTATLLSGLTFHLLKNPDKLQKLTAEIRSAFATEEDISIEHLQQLRYLHACLEEGLRMYPPISNGLPRLLPEGGADLAGVYVPAKSRVFATHLAVYRNPRNFRDPYSFIPERWLPDSDYFQTDKKHALQPFSVGPRMCLGKSMAYHEMRLILAKLLYNFDLQLCPESQGWIDQKIFIMWDKGPLYCQMTEAKGNID